MKEAAAYRQRTSGVGQRYDMTVLPACLSVRVCPHRILEGSQRGDTIKLGREYRLNFKCRDGEKDRAALLGKQCKGSVSQWQGGKNSVIVHRQLQKLERWIRGGNASFSAACPGHEAFRGSWRGGTMKVPPALHMDGYISRFNVSGKTPRTCRQRAGAL